MKKRILWGMLAVVWFAVLTGAFYVSPFAGLWLLGASFIFGYVATFPGVVDGD